MPPLFPKVMRSASGRRLSPRSYWCSLGGLVTVVRARTFDEARHLSARRFSAGGRGWRTPEKVAVRHASRSDLARWAALLEQDAAGVDGARTVLPDFGSQEALFDVA